MATRESDDLPTLDVTSRGTEFVDNEGRTLTLRGVNLGGAKLPAGYRSDQSEEAGDDASYVGRPFPLAEAAEHLGRLRAWGFNIVRLSVTWDALEHKGPKQCADLRRRDRNISVGVPRGPRDQGADRDLHP